jgi:hypothetical protein
MNDVPKSLREKISDHLSNHTHPWTIGGVVLLGIFYGVMSKSGSPTLEALIGRTVLFFVSAVSFTGGLLALIMMASMKSSDFAKLEKFQVYLIVGIGISTLAAGIVIFQALGLVQFPPSAPAR